MMAAIAHGPAYLPDDLLEGSRAAQYRALKAHANTISHARHVALEDTFPRTRTLMGEEAFHEAASRFLTQSEPVSRSLRLIGEGFAALLADPAARDLAQVEYAWLEAHGAAEAPAMLLERLKGVGPETLVAAKVRLHPAARLVVLSRPMEFSWDEADGNGAAVLITRPDAEVRVSRAGPRAKTLFELARTPVPFGRLLARNAEAATHFVQCGALRPLLELVL